MRRYNNGRKNTGSYIGPAALAIFLVLNAALGSNGEGIIVALLSIIVIAALIGTVFVLMKKAAKKGTGFAAMKKLRQERRKWRINPVFPPAAAAPRSTMRTALRSFSFGTDKSALSSWMFF